MIFFRKKPKNEKDFAYPKDFLALRNKMTEDFTPWHFLSENEANAKIVGLNQRYSSGYIPFAQRQDNDDVACWVPPYNGKVRIIHDYASPGRELRKEEYSSFSDWLEMVLKEHKDWVDNGWI